MAQEEAPSAKAVEEVLDTTEEEEFIPDLVKAAEIVKRRPSVFVELFSSQACIFCPQADRLFSDLLTQPDVIGISCHVDYFKVRKGSLSQPFCTDRQGWYMQTLKAGPYYTPQMVVNGRYDVVGYKIDDVTATLDKAREEGFFRLNIVPAADTDGSFDFILPPLELSKDAEMQIWLILYDKLHDITIADGRNHGKVMQYVHIVSGLEFMGPWDGTMAERHIKPLLTDRHGGFIVLVQDKNDGHIVAAGDYKIR